MAKHNSSADSLTVRPLAKPAEISGSVNRRLDSADRALFPRGVAIEDTLVGHLEFALRHEGVNLELIDALFEHLPPQDLLARLDAAPNGAHIRRACHLWEWLTERELPAGASPAGGYVELFPADDYVTAAQPTKDRRFRVRNVYSQEASYRTRQNWLEDATGRVTFFPVPQAELARAMRGWEAFINDDHRCTDVLIKAAAAAFGFVYRHPFMDGNGRLHRFLIHHVLTHSGLLPTGTVVPVSAVILKNIPAYLEVLSTFSTAVTRLWRYVRAEDAPHVSAHPGSRAYRFFDASREVAFLHRMIQQAVEDEIPRELAWLTGYDNAFAQLDAEFDLPRKDLSALIRMTQSSQGRLSARRRKQYFHLPADVLDRVEEVVRESFGLIAGERAEEE